MAGPKKSAVEPLRPDLPIYPIGVAARLLDVHPRTLRIYEAEGLIHPDHNGARRLFSANDIQWTTCLRSMIHDQGISIPGLKRLLALVPCWDIADCPAEVHEACPAKVDRTVTRRPAAASSRKRKAGTKNASSREKAVQR